MNKLSIISLCCIVSTLTSTLAGCGSSTRRKDIVSDSPIAVYVENAANTTNTSDNNSTTSNNITIDEQVLFEQDGLKVTAMEYVTDTIWGDGIKLLVENNGSSDIGLGCTALIVNDYMISDLFSSTIAAGKKDFETLYLYSSSLKAAGIDNVGKIEIYFHTFDAQTYMSISDLPCVTINTSALVSMDNTPDDSGQELYNSDGIRIVGKYVDESSFWGAAVLLYIENNSERNLIIQCEDMSINGFMVQPFFSSDVYSGKKAIDDITIFSSDLEESGITSVDEIELKFKFISEDFMDSFESDVIKFSTH